MNKKNETEVDPFVVVEQDDIPEINNFDDTPEVVGQLVGFKTIKLDGKNVTCAMFENDHGRFGVWISVGLDDLTRMKSGTMVRIRSLGMEKVRKGKGYWRKFEIAFNPKTGGFLSTKD